MSEPAYLILGPFRFDEVGGDATLLSAGGLSLRVASIATLIRMKSGTGRAQDASDIDALRRLEELSDE